jgi:hypothetical protein
MFVTSDTAENNVILFTTLEGIDACHFDFLVEILAVTAVLLHRADDVRTLALVGSDDADLTRLDARLEELGDNLFAVCRFRPASQQRLKEWDYLLRKEVPEALISS